MNSLIKTYGLVFAFFAMPFSMGCSFSYPGDDIISDPKEIPSGDTLQSTVDIPRLNIKGLPSEEALSKALDHRIPLVKRRIYFDTLAGTEYERDLYLKIFQQADMSFGSAPVTGALFASPPIPLQTIYSHLDKLSADDQADVLANISTGILDGRIDFSKLVTKVDKNSGEVADHILKNALHSALKNNDCKVKAIWEKSVRAGVKIVESDPARANKFLLRGLSHYYQLPELWLAIGQTQSWDSTTIAQAEKIYKNQKANYTQRIGAAVGLSSTNSSAKNFVLKEFRLLSQSKEETSHLSSKIKAMASIVRLSDKGLVDLLFQQVKNRYSTTRELSLVILWFRCRENFFSKKTHSSISPSLANLYLVLCANTYCTPKDRCLVLRVLSKSKAEWAYSKLLNKPIPYWNQIRGDLTP